jgi:hypothetical protein
MVIVGRAYSERSPRSRVSSWAQNILRLRAKSLSGEIDLRMRDNEDKALDAAVDIAKRAGIEARANWISHALEASFSISTGALSSFYIDGVIAFGFSLATWQMSKRLDFRSYLGSLLTTRNHLRMLAKAGGGQIEHVWRDRNSSGM